MALELGHPFGNGEERRQGLFWRLLPEGASSEGSVSMAPVVETLLRSSGLSRSHLRTDPCENSVKYLFAPLCSNPTLLRFSPKVIFKKWPKYD